MPTRIIVGSEDRTAPSATNAGRIADAIPGAHCVALDGVGHYGFLAECTATGLKQHADRCHEVPGIERADVHRKVAADAVAFFDNALTTP